MKGRLTQRFVETAGPGRRADKTGTGLLLVVGANGRSWIQRTIIQGKQVDLGLGSCRRVKLAEARRIAWDNWCLARSGGDPRLPGVPRAGMNRGSGARRGRRRGVPRPRGDEPEFERRGYEGITDFGLDHFSGVMNCAEARDVASNRATGEALEGCYACTDEGPFSHIQNCRIYVFEFVRYAGSEPRDPQHPRNCRNLR